MTPAQIDALARQAGVVETAFTDVRHRFQAKFAETEVSQEDGLAWMQGELYDGAPYLFTPAEAVLPWEEFRLDQDTWEALPTAERRRLWQERHPAPLPVKRRPVPYQATADEQQQLDAITNPAARRTAYRALRDSQAR